MSMRLLTRAHRHTRDSKPGKPPPAWTHALSDCFSRTLLLQGTADRRDPLSSEAPGLPKSSEGVWVKAKGTVDLTAH